jgi:hypothetical protein
MCRCGNVSKRSRSNMASGDCDRELTLPPNVVAAIAQRLVDSQRNWVFPLMAMASVSPQWREIVSLLPLGTELQLDGLENAQPLQQKGVAYRASSRLAQRAFLQGVAGLLHGYGSLVCKGPVLNDSIILKVRNQSGES